MQKTVRLIHQVLLKRHFTHTIFICDILVGEKGMHKYAKLSTDNFLQNKCLFLHLLNVCFTFKSEYYSFLTTYHKPKGKILANETTSFFVLSHYIWIKTKQFAASICIQYPSLNLPKHILIEYVSILQEGWISISHLGTQLNIKLRSKYLNLNPGQCLWLLRRTMWCHHKVICWKSSYPFLNTVL